GVPIDVNVTPEKAPEDPEKKELSQFVEGLKKAPESFDPKNAEMMDKLFRLFRYPDLQKDFPALQITSLELTQFVIDLYTDLQKQSPYFAAALAVSDEQMKQFETKLFPKGTSDFIKGLPSGEGFEKKIDEMFAGSEDFKVQALYLVNQDFFKSEFPAGVFDYLKTKVESDRAAIAAKGAEMVETENPAQKEFIKGILSGDLLGGAGEKTGVATGEKPGTEAKPEGEKKSGTAKTIEDVKNLSLGELMKKMFEQLSDLMKMVSSGEIADIFGFGGLKISKKQLESMKVDLDAAEKNDYSKSPDKALEFVTTALHLPMKKDTATLLLTMQNTDDFVFNNEKNDFKKSNVRVGDLLFFKGVKAPVKGKEDQADFVAIISQTEPLLKMKYMTAEGVKKEEEVMKSTLFAQNWLGFMKVPERQKPQEEKADNK
ncbi:hypothetical protein KJ951_03550, partial [Patescibacteria group bacterium]|nr:hypothetical protein [Patescibacteria group bacterium]MBU1703453.1 hypothetical protein [Patescibacteria group bacterium]MBU1953341.1 hypothetical protein [Patescibacteria group bacterium]